MSCMRSNRKENGALLHFLVLIPSVREITISRSCRIRTGVHWIDSSVPGITSVDEAKVTLHFDERRGRIVQDRTFDGTQWIELVSPFDEALGFRKKSDVHKLGNYVAISGNTRNLEIGRLIRPFWVLTLATRTRSSLPVYIATTRPRGQCKGGLLSSVTKTRSLTARFVFLCCHFVRI